MKRKRIIIFLLLLIAFANTPFIVQADQISPNNNTGTTTVAASDASRFNPFNNNGSIIITATGTLANFDWDKGVTIYSDGRLCNYADLQNRGWMDNSGNLVNHGKLTNAGTLSNYDALTNNSGATLSNNVTITNNA